MKRREFLKKAGCGAAGFTVIPMAQASNDEKGELVLRRYDIEVEVVEVGPKTRAQYIHGGTRARLMKKLSILRV